MSNVRNCKRCGRVFTYTGKSICMNCLEEEQQDFEKVRDYLFKHHNSSTIEVSEATEVEVKVITRFLREGRLESEGLKLAEEDGLTCEKCDRPIGSGRFCETCLKEMQEGFQRASDIIGTKISKEEASKGHVHTYDAVVKRS